MCVCVRACVCVYVCVHVCICYSINTTGLFGPPILTHSMPSVHPTIIEDDLDLFPFQGGMYVRMFACLCVHGC